MWYTVFRGDKVLVVLIRSIILYIAVLIALRFMGKGEIGFLEIGELVEKVMNEAPKVETYTVEDVYNADIEARNLVIKYSGKQ